MTHPIYISRPLLAQAIGWGVIKEVDGKFIGMGHEFVVLERLVI